MHRTPLRANRVPAGGRKEEITQSALLLTTELVLHLPFYLNVFVPVKTIYIVKATFT